MTGLDRASGLETWSLSSSHTTPAPTPQKEDLLQRLTQLSQGSYSIDMAESHTHTHHKTLEVQESRAVASGERGQHTCPSYYDRARLKRCEQDPSSTSLLSTHPSFNSTLLECSEVRPLHRG